MSSSSVGPRDAPPPPTQPDLAHPDPDRPDRPPVQSLLEPRDGVPLVIVDQHALARAADRIRSGTGPVAMDAERASGYRYGNHAYLVQLRRQGSGTALVDPTTLTDVGPLAAALEGTEWVLHAASQDLSCLAELGLVPSRLFDTELAGRLLGYPRVALGTLVEEVLGFRLEKGHAAVDWSRRPMPDTWLRYAALDVEMLVELRDALAEQLRAAGKDRWAEEEFDALCHLPPSEPRVEPWRRTSGLHRVRKARQLAVVRELWDVRERIAERRNLAPGRILPDTAIVAAALALPATSEELVAVPGFGGRATRKSAETWFRAVEAGRTARRPPSLARAYDGPPPPRTWPTRNPAAAARLAASRQALTALATELDLPTENLLSPDTVRRLSWEPPNELSETTVGAALRSARARPWQVKLTAPVLATAIAGASHTHPPDGGAAVPADETDLG